MKSSILIGVILIVLGVLTFAYQGITYTKRDKLIDVGPIHATKDTTKTIPLPPIIGGLLLVGGIAIIVFGPKNK